MAARGTAPWPAGERDTAATSSRSVPGSAGSRTGASLWSASGSASSTGSRSSKHAERVDGIQPRMGSSEDVPPGTGRQAAPARLLLAAAPAAEQIRPLQRNIDPDKLASPAP